MLITKATTAAVIAVAAIGVMSIHPMMAKARQAKQNEAVAAVASAAKARYDAIDQAFNKRDAAAAFKLLPHVVIGQQNHLITFDRSNRLAEDGIVYYTPWTRSESELQQDMNDSPGGKMTHVIGAISVTGNIATVAMDWGIAYNRFSIFPGSPSVMDKFTCGDTWVKGSTGWELQRRTVNAETVVGADGKPNTFVTNRLMSGWRIQTFAYEAIMYTLVHDGRYPTVEDASIYKPFTYNPALSNLTLQQIVGADDSRGEKVPMLYEAAPDANGNRLVAFVDGHQELMRAEPWKALSNFTTILIKK